MDEENSINKALLAKFHEYYAAHLDWEKRKSHARGIALRKILRDIRNLAHERRMEIMDERAKKIRKNKKGNAHSLPRAWEAHRLKKKGRNPDA